MEGISRHNQQHKWKQSIPSGQGCSTVTRQGTPYLPPRSSRLVLCLSLALLLSLPVSASARWQDEGREMALMWRGLRSASEPSCRACKREETCQGPNQCGKCDSEFKCTGTRLECRADGKCDVPRLFDSFDWRCIILIICVISASAMANAAGIGGGIFFAPLLHLVLNFSTQQAAGNTQPLIFGGTLANFMYNLPQRHPIRKTAPKIDWDLVVCIIPCFFAGTPVGIIFYQSLPDLLSSWMLSMILLFLLIQSLRRGTQMCRYQLRARKRRAAAAVVGKPAVSSLGYEDEDDIDDALGQLAAQHFFYMGALERKQRMSEEARLRKENAERAIASQPENALNLTPWPWPFDRFDPLLQFRTLDELHQKENRMLPMGHIAFIALAWFTAFIFRDSKGGRSIVGLRLCSSGYWVSFAVQELLMVAYSVCAVWRMSRLHRVRTFLKYTSYAQVSDGEFHDMSWHAREIVGYPIFLFLVGASTAWLGIGGAVIMVPTFINFSRLDPVVTSCTIGVVNMIGSSMTTAQIASIGGIFGDYASFYGALSFVGSATGVYVVMYLVHKFQLRAIIIYILALAFAVCLALMLDVAVEQTIEAKRLGRGLSFARLCPS